MDGSSVADWTRPATSLAREVTACSPGEESGQSRDQIFQACSASLARLTVTDVHWLLSIDTSTRATGHVGA
jgi:aryl-alcohol dehydrogenase-like predicted oxidoreductase